tara:strand:- start:69 stop:386 length:318 start_codon:yes stop_codon:yes gene_type:complete
MEKICLSCKIKKNDIEFISKGKVVKKCSVCREKMKKYYNKKKEVEEEDKQDILNECFKLNECFNIIVCKEENQKKLIKTINEINYNKIEPILIVPNKKINVYTIY